MGYFRGDDCWWGMETGAWVPAPGQVEGRPCAGMPEWWQGQRDGGQRACLGMGYFRGKDGLVMGRIFNFPDIFGHFRTLRLIATGAG